jgi:hypothetical protein
MATIGDFGGTLFLSIIAVILIVILVYLVIVYIRGRREARLHHVELYFDEHFRDIINEWDLTSRTKIKEWEPNMTKRLNDVGKDIDKLMSFRKSFDSRLDGLEADIKKYEVL